MSEMNEIAIKCLKENIFNRDNDFYNFLVLFHKSPKSKNLVDFDFIRKHRLMIFSIVIKILYL